MRRPPKPPDEVRFCPFLRRAASSRRPSRQPTHAPQILQVSRPRRGPHQIGWGREATSQIRLGEEKPEWPDLVLRRITWVSATELHNIGYSVFDLLAIGELPCGRPLSDHRFARFQDTLYPDVR